MNALIPLLYQLKKSDRGATAVEYGIMVALIAVAIIGAVLLVGQNLDAIFDFVAERLAVPAAP